MSWSGKIQLGANAGDSDRAQAGNRRYPFVRLNDLTGQNERVTSFDNIEELVEAQSLRDENGRCLYDTDPAFRVTVEEMVANSPALLAEDSLSRRDVIPTNEEMMKGLKEDALRQQRDRLVDAAGGGDLVAKYQLAQALMDENNYEGAHEMGRATESSRPYEDYLKQRAAQGLPPEQFSIPTEDLPQEKSLEQRASEMHLDNSFQIDLGEGK